MDLQSSFTAIPSPSPSLLQLKDNLGKLKTSQTFDVEFGMEQREKQLETIKAKLSQLKRNEEAEVMSSPQKRVLDDPAMLARRRTSIIKPPKTVHLIQPSPSVPKTKVNRQSPPKSDSKTSAEKQPNSNPGLVSTQTHAPKTLVPSLKPLPTVSKSLPPKPLKIPHVQKTNKAPVNSNERTVKQIETKADTVHTPGDIKVEPLQTEVEPKTENVEESKGTTNKNPVKNSVPSADKRLTASKVPKSILKPASTPVQKPVTRKTSPRLVTPQKIESTPCKKSPSGRKTTSSSGQSTPPQNGEYVPLDIEFFLKLQQELENGGNVS
jgi:hypothetical protein